MIKNIEAAIFDMDGTVVDSMWIWGKIDIDYLNKRGLTMPENLKEEIEHLSFEETSKYFKKRFNLPDSLEEIQSEWMNMAYHEYHTNIKLKPGVMEFLSLLKASGIKIGLATSNCDLLIKAGLNSTGIYDYFDSITTTDEVSRGKNYPDVYLLAAKKLGAAPEKCIVFEDILSAVKGAKASGMKVVGIYDAFSEYQKEEIIKHVDKYIVNYDELIEAI
jgi:HAD superfamily hydrolase (TIGR01509 family)